MRQRTDLQLLPDEPGMPKPRPVFASQQEYEKFREDFYESVKPELEKLALARARSWQQAFNGPPLRTA